MPTGEDWGLLHAYPILVTYLIEDAGAGSCSRLKWYLGIAKNFLVTDGIIDSLGNQPSNRRGLVDDQSYRETQIADVVIMLDKDLHKMFQAAQAQPMTADVILKRICQLYARIVIGHEGDSDCKTIVAAFIGEGILQASRTCD